MICPMHCQAYAEQQESKNKGRARLKNATKLDSSVMQWKVGREEEGFREIADIRVGEK